MPPTFKKKYKWFLTNWQAFLRISNGCASLQTILFLTIQNLDDSGFHTPTVPHTFVQNMIKNLIFQYFSENLEENGVCGIRTLEMEEMMRRSKSYCEVSNALKANSNSSHASHIGLHSLAEDDKDEFRASPVAKRPGQKGVRQIYLVRIKFRADLNLVHPGVMDSIQIFVSKYYFIYKLKNVLHLQWSSLVPVPFSLW